jgi:chromosome segregation ATPase
MLRKVSTLSIAAALVAGVLLAAPASAAVSNGSTCTTLNKTTKVSGFTYKCVAAVKSTVTLDGTKTTIFLPASSLKVKNSKRYYLAAEPAEYAKTAKEIAALQTSTAKAVADLDAQIVTQGTASKDVQSQIDELTKENAALELKVKEQTDLIPVAQKEADSLTLKIAGVQKQVDDFTVILNDSKAKLATLKADTVNATKNATAISKLSTAITQLSTSITSLKTSNSQSKIQLQSVNGSISKYNSSIMQLKSTIKKNLSSIEAAKKIDGNVTALTKTREITLANFENAKSALAQTLNSRNLLCSAGL